MTYMAQRFLEYVNGLLGVRDGAICDVAVPDPFHVEPEPTVSSHDVAKQRQIMARLDRVLATAQRLYDGAQKNNPEADRGALASWAVRAATKNQKPKES